MTFEEYLTKRRVNVAAFAAGEPPRFAEWQVWYGQMHPESFYLMVKMVLNDVRRKFWLAEVPKPVAVAARNGPRNQCPASRQKSRHCQTCRYTFRKLPDSRNFCRNKCKTCSGNFRNQTCRKSFYRNRKKLQLNRPGPFSSPRAVIKKPPNFRNSTEIEKSAENPSKKPEPETR